MTSRHHRAPRILPGVVLATAAVLALSACGGSAVSAKKAVGANQAVKGQAAAASGDSTGTGNAVGDVPVGDLGTGDVAPGTGGATPTAGGGGGTTTTGGGTTTTGGGRAAPATGQGIKAGSCAGFKNTTGITDSTITIGNIADISGPVPGIFTAAANATKAYAAYFNSTSKICGRKLAVKSYDSQTNTSGDSVATQKTCDETFAAVGSMDAFDSGGTSVAKACKIPEIHAIITNDARADCDNCFAASAPSGGLFQRSIPDYFTRHNKAATQKAAMVYVNAAASVGAAKGQVKAEERAGWKFVYTGSFDIAEFNYGPYVQKMKSAGVQLVQMYGSSDMAIRMAQAFEAANFKPDLFILPATQYDKNYAAGGKAVDGTILFVDFTPIEDMAKNPELALYNRWLQQVAPGSQPTYFGLYAWSASRLFAEQATLLGGKLTRPNLVKQLRTIKNWTSNGLHAPQAVGSKRGTPCARFLQLRNGTWKSYGGSKYYCNGQVSSR
ncbi:ABC-type branched-subunit amino acid transport system substrate-binding protein [Marmoricola sp. OAE513]|uniref:ABC transporter substrate-binding protein n=1 Tax=Marmoricola sp. OAE513 TaxID=2817894 RepID=UPI001AEA2EA2